MAALTKDALRAHKIYNTVSIPVLAATTLYKGALIGVDATGYAVAMADTADIKFAGVAIEGVDNSAGSDGDLNVQVDVLKVQKIACTGATQAWVGFPVYAVDDNTVGLIATTTEDIIVGTCVSYISATQVWVYTNGTEEELNGLTSSMAELNILDGCTATFAELNQLDGGWASIDETLTSASGHVDAQFVFKDAAGVAMTEPVTGEFYVSELATGLDEHAMGTTLAVLTNGSVTNIVDKGRSGFITDATGKLGVRLTNGGADSFWIVFKSPSGKLIISGEMIEQA